ncbi:MAG: Hsp20/alpha crystallin family protein [Bacteroidia bacterium]|nr:Hsp20/alpha crystallin family protein [Bacteroidia bacterium]
MVLLKSKPQTYFNDVFIPSQFHGMLNEILSPKTDKKEFSPKAELIEKEKHFEINMALPGMKKEDVKISIENDRLIVSGEKKSFESVEGEKVHFSELNYGAFNRQFNLGKVNRTGIEATFNDGILTVSLPKSEEAQSLNIEIQ